MGTCRMRFPSFLRPRTPSAGDDDDDAAAMLQDCKCCDAAQFTLTRPDLT